MTRARMGLALVRVRAGPDGLVDDRLRANRALEGQGRRRRATSRSKARPSMTMESKEMNRKLTTKTDRRGEYTHFLAPGDLPRHRATKDNLIDSSQITKVSIDEKRAQLHADGRRRWLALEYRTPSARRRKPSRAAVQALVHRGRDAQQRRQDTTRRWRSSTRCSPRLPKCVECYTNIGALIQMRKKDYDAAEAAYKKAIEVNREPTSERRVHGPRQRLQHSEEVRPGDGGERAGVQNLLALPRPGGAAGGAASASDNLFNQGVIAWNAEQDPRRSTEAVRGRRSPPIRKYADAQYWLGMANWSTRASCPKAVKSLRGIPQAGADSGQYADQAKGMIAAIKK